MDPFGARSCNRCGCESSIPPNSNVCNRCDCDEDADITIRRRRTRRGDSWFLYFQIVQDVTSLQFYTAFIRQQIPANATPVNITGWSIWVTIKKYPNDPDNQALAQLTITGGGVTLDQPLSGVGHSIMPPSATSGLPDGVVPAIYDVQAKDLLGNIYTVESGTLLVSPDVTRATS